MNIANRTLIQRVMPQHNPFRRLGFSLIELVIVVVILAVLAAVAIPRLSRGTRTAGSAALKRDLAALRSALEIYAAEHDGKYPDSNIMVQLIGYSDSTGSLLSKTKDPTGEMVYGPYLKEIPPLPVGTNQGFTDIYITSDSKVSFSVLGTRYGWWYNPARQAIRAFLPDSDADDDKVPYNTY